MSLVVVATGLFVLMNPVDAGNFEAISGEAWDEFSSASPGVADYLAREGRILGVLVAIIGAISLTATWFGLRPPVVWGKWVLISIMVGFAGVGAIFLASGDEVLTWTYFGLAILFAIIVGFAGEPVEEG